MSKEKEQAPVFRTRATVDPSTFDEKNNTVEVTFATNTEVFMGWCYETLSFEKGHVRMDRINAGANVLDNHNKWSSVQNGVLGVVENAKLETSQGRALLRLSNRKELEGFRQDVKDGILRNISCGYRVYKYEHLNPNESNAVPRYRAIDWEPQEISFVSVPADYNATVRSENSESFSNIEIINSRSSLEMLKKEKTPEQINAELTSKEAGSVDNTRSQNDNPPAAIVEQNRSQNNPDADPLKIANEAIAVERKRSAGIYEAASLAGLPQDFARSLVDNGTSLNDANALIIKEFAKADPQTRSNVSIKNEGEKIDNTRSAIERALMHRAAPGLFQIEGEAMNYRGHSLVDVARSIIELKGEKTLGLMPSEIAERALTTSDFPILLSNVTNQILRKAYGEGAQTWKPLATQYSASDFKAIGAVQFGGNIILEEVKESGEFKQAKMAESKESFALKTYGKIVSISRQAIINDDLNGFARVATLFGRSAANLESKIMWGMITNNVKMSDGKALFHADHNNIITGVDSALSEAGLSAARLKMMRQTGLDKETIDLMPKFLVVPPELEMTARKLLATITATATGDVNVFANAYTIIVEHRLTNAAEWYLMASPSQIDMLAYAYLNGNAGLTTETRYGFEVDGVQVKARLDFGAGVMDFRGLQKNAGA